MRMSIFQWECPPDTEMKLFGNNLKQKWIQGLKSSQCDILKFKTVTILIHVGYSNEEE